MATHRNPDSALAMLPCCHAAISTAALWVGRFTGLQRHLPGAAGAQAGFIGIASNPTNPASLAGQEVLALFQAQDGKLWLGTQKHGAAWLNPAQTAQTAATPEPNYPPLHWLAPDPQRANHLSHGWVYAIAQPQPGQIWLGTLGGGINIVSAQDGTVLQRLKHDPANASSLMHDNIHPALDFSVAPAGQRIQNRWQNRRPRRAGGRRCA